MIRMRFIKEHTEFIEVSYVGPYVKREYRDVHDLTRYWWITGQHLLRQDPFELDRWADDGGPAVDHW